MIRASYAALRQLLFSSLRKHAYSNILKILLPKIENFQLKISDIFHISAQNKDCRPRWLSWMRRLTGDQEVAGSTPAEVGNILSWRLIVKYFLRSFSPFR